MADKENRIEILESQFPAMSGIAFEAARKEALDSGLSVLQSEEGVIFEVFPDGSRKLVKLIAPPVKVGSGQKISIW